MQLQQFKKVKPAYTVAMLVTVTRLDFDGSLVVATMAVVPTGVAPPEARRIRWQRCRVCVLHRFAGVAGVYSIQPAVLEDGAVTHRPASFVVLTISAVQHGTAHFANLSNSFLVDRRAVAERGVAPAWAR